MFNRKRKNINYLFGDQDRMVDQDKEMKGLVKFRLNLTIIDLV